MDKFCGISSRAGCSTFQILHVIVQNCAVTQCCAMILISVAVKPYKILSVFGSSQ